MSNDIVVSRANGAIARYGDSAELDVLAERFAQFFNIPEKDMNLPSVRTAALKAAQLTVRFGLTPGVHIYIVKRGGTYAAEESLEAWKDAASKHSRIGHFLYDVQVREMTPEDVKQFTPLSDRYTAEDKGAFARVIRFDIAKEYKNIGLVYDPLWVKGFWRKEAYEKKSWDGKYMKGTGQWEPDTVPNQRTPQDVAIRRATRAALKSAFTLIQLDDLDAAHRMQAAMYHMQVASAPLLNTPTEADLFVGSAEDEGLWSDSIPGVATLHGGDGDGLWSEPAQVVAPVPEPAPVAPNGNGKEPTAESAKRGFHAVGVKVFGDEWNAARPWLLKRYTVKNTPESIREHTSDMTVKELTSLRSDMDRFADHLRKEWAKENPPIDQPLDVSDATEAEGAALFA